jgi:ABC-type dipeptide/oligopeptide/nickel transport system ATPase component
MGQHDWAIIIGINEYEHHPEQNLFYSIHDARLIQKCLCESLGFPEEQVILLRGEISYKGQHTYPTYANIQRWINREMAPESIGQVEHLWFFFSGHGINRDGIEYLIPCDALREDTKLMLSVPEVTACLCRHQDADVVMIMEICREYVASKNLVAEMSDSPHETYQSGLITLYSCSHGELSYELKTLQHSSFTYALCEKLGNPKELSKLALFELEQFLQARVRELNSQSGIVASQNPKIIVDSPGRGIKPLLLNSHVDVNSSDEDFGNAAYITQDLQNKNKDSLGEISESIIAQSFKNDSSEGEDLLGIQMEVDALAEVLAMRDLQPPLAVGILGSWGSGKSFVMHLMSQRLKALYKAQVSKEQAWKSESDNKSDDSYPYVGHIYQIHFNSWTYAKVDLWSSLMQTIFYELNQQLTLEKHLNDTLTLYQAIKLLAKEKGDLEDPEEFIHSLQNEYHGASPLPQILDPQFWESCKDAADDQPPNWKGTDWIILSQQGNFSSFKFKSIIHNFQSLTSQDLTTIWKNAREYAIAEIRQGGELLDIVDSKKTADQRDKVFKKMLEKKEIGEGCFQVWQKVISSSRVQGVVWSELSNLRKRDQEELESIEQALSSAKQELASQQEIAELAAKSKLEREQIAVIWQPVLTQAYKLLGIEPDKIIGWKRIWHTLYCSPRIYIGLLCLIALIVLIETLNQSARVQFFAFYIDTIWNVVKVRFTEIYTQYWLVSLPLTGALFQQIWNIIQKYIHEVKKKKVEIENEYPTWLQEEQKAANILKFLKTVEDLQLQVEQKRNQVGLIANEASLLKFVNNRLQENDYNQSFGIIHQISRDLADLSRHLVYRDQDSYSEGWYHTLQLFPRGPARVVLYIDDLDRCPPDRVVDVLEAVQLLLNTPLFVVVLAIDDCYIARALEQVYQGVLTRRGKPSGIDYLEKIIQIPYRTRPITGDRASKYILSQIVIEDIESNLNEENIEVLEHRYSSHLP